MDEFVANRVQDQHLVLALLDFSLVVVPQLTLRPDSRHRAQMEQRLEPFAGVLTDPGTTSDAAPLLIIEGSNPSMAGHLFGIGDGFHFIGSDDDLGSSSLADARNRHHQLKELTQARISFDECVDGFVNSLAVFLQVS